MHQKMTVIVDEITGALIAPVSQYAEVFQFTASQGINSNVEVAAEELNQLIKNDGKRYVLVASSIGAFAALTYAHKFPGRLSGLVLIDPSHPRQGIALLAILDDQQIADSPELENVKKMCRASNEASESGKQQLDQIATLGDLPLLVLMAGAISFGNAIPKDLEKLITENRHEMLKAYARLSSKGKSLVIPNVGHGIAAEAPELVADIIKGFIAEIA